MVMEFSMPKQRQGLRIGLKLVTRLSFARYKSYIVITKTTFKDNLVAEGSLNKCPDTMHYLYRYSSIPSEKWSNVP